MEGFNNKKENTKKEENRFEAVFGSEEMQYLHINQIMRSLVPAMRQEDIKELILSVYQGETDIEIADLQVFDDGRSTKLFDEDGKEISLFRASGQGGMRNRRGPSKSSRTSLSQWLTEKGYSQRDVTFCPFLKESDEEVAPESFVELQEESQKRKKPKRVKNKRKKKTRQEKKDNREISSGEYKELLISLKNIPDVDISNGSEGLDIFTIVNGLRDLSNFLGRHPEYTQRAENDIQSEENFAAVRKRLMILRSASSFKGARRNEDNAWIMRLFRLAKRIFPDSDGDRTDAAEYGYYFDHMGRGIDTYESNLFGSDIGMGEDFYNFLASLDEETWLDIGSGTTYKNPNSLMNRLPEINPKITLIGIDPLYDLEEAREIDLMSEQAGIDERYVFPHTHLLPDSAQDISLEDKSVDRVISTGVFEKFNIDNDSDKKAIEEIFRVLKKGGEARLSPLPARNATRIERFAQGKFSVKKERVGLQSGKGEYYFLKITKI